MKHLLLITLLSFSTLSVMGQACIPDQSFANSGPGIYPLSIATVDCSDTLSTKTIVSITDTSLTSPIAVTIYYDSTRVASISGLPAGLSFGTDVDDVTNAFAPFGAWENGGSIPNLTPAVGCVYVHGNPAAWAAAASGGMAGNYTLTVMYDARISQAIPDLTPLGIPPGTWLSNVPASFGGGLIPIEFPIDANPTNTLDATVTGTTDVDGTTAYNYTTASGASSYNWTVTGGTLQSGQGTNSIMVVWNGGNSTGDVEVTVGDGTCEETDNLAITSIITGISEVGLKNTLVYPNPSNGVFNIRIEANDVVYLEVTDLSGKVVLTEQFAGPNHALNVENIPVGIYLLKLETNDGIAISRLIKN